METTIKINTDALSSDLIDGVKKLLSNQIVEKKAVFEIK